MLNPEYKFNPETHEKMVDKLFERYKTRGNVMPPEQKKIYEEIAKRCTGLIVLDVGCGLGIGTNILATEARFVWGIDREPEHIDFATQMFRRKNLSGMGQIEFEQFDLVNPPTREFSRFHVITCIDVLEHIEDYQKALNTIKRFYNPGKTTLFVSTPNRNAEKFKDNLDHPWNPYHIREWSIGEFYDILTKNFQFVTLWNWNMEEKIDLDSTVTPIVAQLEGNLL